MRVVGVDLSLTSTGLAVVDDGEHVQTARVGSKPAGMGLTGRSERLRGLVARIWPYVVTADLVVIESPAFASKMGAAHDRSGLWWMLVGRMTGNGIPVAEVTIQHLKMYATGAGNADKDRVLAAVVKRYTAVEVTGNDVADALVLAAMGSRWAGSPLESDLPAHHLRALDKVSWPTQPKE